MGGLFERPLEMFLALFALYSPLAAVSSYFPIVSKLSPKEQFKLSMGLFLYVMVFVVTAIWVGEPLLELLGLSTDALQVTGGIALIFVGVELMRSGPASDEDLAKEEKEKKKADTKQGDASAWRSVLFMPVTFPLTVGGTTFAILVSFRSMSSGLPETLALTGAGAAYAAVTAITVYASGHLERRVSPTTRFLLEKIAGILLTAIAVSLLLSGGPRMVAETLAALKAK